MDARCQSVVVYMRFPFPRISAYVTNSSNHRIWIDFLWERMSRQKVIDIPLDRGAEFRYDTYNSQPAYICNVTPWEVLKHSYGRYLPPGRWQNRRTSGVFVLDMWQLEYNLNSLLSIGIKSASLYQ